MANLRTVAREALGSVNETWTSYLSINGYDPGAAELPDDAYDHELGLYVYQNGTWLVDHAQYLVDHRGLLSYAPIAHYQSINALYSALHENTTRP